MASLSQGGTWQEGDSARPHVPIPIPILPAEPGLSCDARSQQGWPRAQTRRQPAPSEIPASHIPEQLMEEFSPLLAANELDPSFNSLCVDWMLGPFVFPAWLSSSGVFFLFFIFAMGAGYIKNTR